VRLLVAVAGAWCAGIFVEGAIRGAEGAWIAAVLIAGGAACLLAALRRSAVIISVLLAWAGGGLDASVQRAHAARDPGWPDADVVMEGVIVRPVEEGPDFRCAEVDVDAISGDGGLAARVLVTWQAEDDGSPLPLPGDRVRFTGTPRARAVTSTKARSIVSDSCVGAGSIGWSPQVHRVSCGSPPVRTVGSFARRRSCARASLPSRTTTAMRSYRRSSSAGAAGSGRRSTTRSVAPA
jgi:hypothetical protein